MGFLSRGTKFEVLVRFYDSSQFYIFSVAVSRCEDLRFIINVFRLRVLNVPLSHLRAQELELCAIESRIGTVLTSPLTMFI